MKQKTLILLLGCTLLFAMGVALRYWQKNRATAQTSNVYPSDLESGQVFEQLDQFSTKSGIQVKLLTYSECRNCDAPEFLAIQTDRDQNLEDILAPKRFNTNEFPGRDLKSKVIYGACSEQVLVYQHYIEDGTEPLSRLWEISFNRDQEIQISDRKIPTNEFDQVWTAENPIGCESFSAQGPF